MKLPFLLLIGIILISGCVGGSRSYTTSTCTGFQYFQYADQRLSPTEFSLELVNGNSDVVITSIQVDGNSVATTTTPTGVQTAGSSFIVTGTGSLTDKSPGKEIETVISIVYDVENDISNNIDTGTCVGIVA